MSKLLANLKLQNSLSALYSSSQYSCTSLNASCGHPQPPSSPKSRGETFWLLFPIQKGKGTKDRWKPRGFLHTPRRGKKSARHEQDSNLCGETPLDFESNALTTRPPWLPRPPFTEHLQKGSVQRPGAAGGNGKLGQAQTHSLWPPHIPLLTSASTPLKGRESGGSGDPRRKGLSPHEDEGLKEHKAV